MASHFRQEKRLAAKPEIKDAKGIVVSKAVALDEDKLEKWEIKAERAAGALKTGMSHDVKVLIRDCKDNPLLIWETLKISFIQQQTIPHFNAYHALLSVEKSDSETLDSLINRVDEQIRVIRLLSPSSFTLDQLYDKLAVMAIIRALPHSFDNIMHTILVLDKFDKPSVVQLLCNMDHIYTNLSSTTSTFTVFSGAPRHLQNMSIAPVSSFSPFSPQNSQNRAPNLPKYDFCLCLGHIEVKCFLKKKLMHQMSLPSSSTAAPASTTLQPTPQAIPGTPQSAYIASASSLFVALSPDSHFSSWNTDSGASAHMTFNQHWMCNMMPHHIPICLADGSVEI